MPTSRITTSLLVLLAACSDPTTSSQPGAWGPFRLDRESYFAGSDVVVYGTGPMPRTGKLRLMYDEVPLVRTSDTSLAGELPTTLSGGRQPAVLELAGEPFPLDSLQGFGITIGGAGGIAVLPGTDFLVPTATWSGHPVVLYPQSDGIVQLDANFSGWGWSSGVSTPGLGSPGPTPDPQEWIVRSSVDGPLERRRLDTFGSEYRDTVPSFARSAFRAYAVLGPDAIVAYVGDSGWIAHRDSHGSFEPALELIHEGPKRVVMSPRGDRAALIAGGGFILSPIRRAAIPVFSLPEGDVAYDIPNLLSVSAASFTPDGDTLVVAGSPFAGTPKSVLMLRASDGGVLEELSPPRDGGDRPPRGPDEAVPLRPGEGDRGYPRALGLPPVRSSACGQDGVVHLSALPLADRAAR